jgi:hypothetical protein
VVKDSYSQAEAFAFFDTLAPVGPGELRGAWRGGEVRTGHPLDGLLTKCRWWGKEFLDEDHVHPLVFARADGSHFYANPSLMPFSPLLNRLPVPVLQAAFRLSRPLITTTVPAAHLTERECRGVRSAAMVYNRIPVTDCFRRAGDDTLFALMDRPDKSGQTLFFTLTRAG